MQKNYSVKVDKDKPLGCSGNGAQTCGVDYSSDSEGSVSSNSSSGSEPPAEIIEPVKRKYVRKKPINPEAVAEKLAKARANRKPPKEKKQPKQKLEPLEAPEPKIINNYYYNNGKDKEQPPEPQTPRQIPKPAVKPAVKPKPIMSFV